MQKINSKSSSWPIYISGAFITIGMYLLASKSVKDEVILNIPLNMLGGVIIVAGLVIFTFWLLTKLFSNLIFVLRNYKLFPKVFKLTKMQQDLDEEAEKINKDISNLKDLVQEHESKRTNS